MRKTILLLAAASTAAAAPYHHTTTGEILVRDFLATSQANVPSPDAVMAHERARGYIDGIKDATQGTLWCYTGNLKPAELNYDLIDAVRAAPAAARRSNAAPLVINILATKFPCTGKGSPK